jgi:hypothetical protein
MSTDDAKPKPDPPPLTRPDSAFDASEFDRLPPEPGRNANGHFAPGNTLSRGVPRPHTAKIALMRSTIFAEITPERWQKIIRAMYTQAIGQFDPIEQRWISRPSVKAAEWLSDRLIGKPVERRVEVVEQDGPEIIDKDTERNRAIRLYRMVIDSENTTIAEKLSAQRSINELLGLLVDDPRTRHQQAIEFKDALQKIEEF